MSGEAFEKRRKAFEEEFFQKQSQKLVDKLRETLQKKQTREELQQLTGIQDAGVLDTLMAMHLAKDTFAAFALYPLVEVAWADGSVDEKERKAFLAAAAEHGIAPGSPAHAALEEFVKTTPSDDTRKAWYAWAAELNRKLDAAERKKVRDGLVQRARAVAQASGGILGLGSKISANEQRILDAITRAFPD
ncbi:MAG TPA: TerB family tellurite resistance protein [Myxococcota bacterium]|jgi:uncharacterized tellurite resistance protein B-like protein